MILKLVFRLLAARFSARFLFAVCRSLVTLAGRSAGSLVFAA
jgi:hypothetical protein